MTIDNFLPTQEVLDLFKSQNPLLFQEEGRALLFEEAATAIAVVARCALVDALRESPAQTVEGYNVVLAQDLGVPCPTSLEYARIIWGRLDEQALKELILNRPALR